MSWRLVDSLLRRVGGTWYQRDSRPHCSQIDDLAFASLILHDGGIKYVNNVLVFEAAVSLDFPHSCLDPFLTRGHQYLLQRITSARGDVRHQVDERESTFS
jgi:hypothetical protein